MTTSGVTDDLSRGMPQAVFVSDPSAEAENIAQLLRSRGYLVADVPLSMLVARVAVQRPRVLLVDADGETALETLARMRELPEADAIDVVFLGRENGAIGNIEDALARDGSGFFSRPVDVSTLLKKIEALTGGPSDDQFAPGSWVAGGSKVRPSSPPASVSATSIEAPRRPGTLPPPSMRDLGDRPSPIPRPPTSLVPPLGLDDKRSLAAHHVSSELEQLLAEAEQRIGGQVIHESVFPTPDEEIEAVLPADVLASLDEPIDDEADDDEPLGADVKAITSAGGGGKVTTGTGTGGVGEATGGSVRATSGGRAPITEPPVMPRTSHGAAEGTGGRGLTEYGARESVSHDDASVAPPSRGGTAPPSSVGREAGTEPAVPRPASLPPANVPHVAVSELPRLIHAAEPQRRGGQKAIAPTGLGLGPSAPMPSVLAPGDAARTIAQAIVTRATGALCIEAQDGVRRAVLREGDLVTAASGVDSESLVVFLVGRGDLPREEATRLQGKLAPFGRHAGAALVAHGHLRQDQLWSVLREHAEWVLGRMIQQSTGTAVMEAEPPGRLRGEPSVFGGSTGAEVFVEIVRRVIAPGEALARLGGPASRIGEGANPQLFDECALEPSVAERLQNARGGPVQALLARSPESDIASVLYALELLGVVEMVHAIGEARTARAATPAPAPSADSIDEDAVRARVRARLQLVEEGDYFALLGISRNATTYEVRRAFLDLRRAFEPARILTPQIADLAQDVHKIAIVLDEAYEILKDTARRERYRRAIEGPHA